MKVSTEIDNNFGYEKITQLVDNIPSDNNFGYEKITQLVDNIHAVGRQYPFKYPFKGYCLPTA